RRKPPAPRSSMAPNTLGESIHGKHIHSTLPLLATSAATSQSDRKPYSAIGGNGEAAEVCSSSAACSNGRVATLGSHGWPARPSLTDARLDICLLRLSTRNLSP